jgi:hypothetical protein
MNIIEKNKTHLINGAIATGALWILNFIDKSSVPPVFIAASTISYIGLGTNVHEDTPKPMNDLNIPSHTIDHSDYMKCNNENKYVCI